VSSPVTVAAPSFEQLQLLSQIQAASGGADAANTAVMKEQGTGATKSQQAASAPAGMQRNAAGFGEQPHSMTALMLVLLLLGAVVDLIG
jgi:hypothetical protein